MTQIQQKYNLTEHYEDVPYQQEFHKSTAKIRTIIGARRGGKGRMACMDMAAFITTLSKMKRPAHLVPKYYILLVAPVYPDARQMWMEAQELIPRHLIAGDPRQNERTMDLVSGGFLSVRSADVPGTIKGIGVDYCWITEAWKIPDQIWHEDVRPTLFSPDRLGLAVIDTIAPLTGDHWVEDLYWRGQDPDDKVVDSWRFTYLDNPLMTEEVRAEIEAEKEYTPIHQWERQYLAVTGKPEDAVFHNVDACATGELEEPIQGCQYYMGLDLGKLQNFTVATIIRRDTGRAVKMERYSGLSWPAQEERIVSLCHEYNYAPIIVDATSLGGEFVADALRAAGANLPYTNRFVFSMSSKAALIEKLALAFEKHHIVIPKGESGPPYRMAIRELKNYRRQILPSGQEKFGPRQGWHDDCVDSLALAWYKMPRQGGGFAGSYAPSRSYMVSV